MHGMEVESDLLLQSIMNIPPIRLIAMDNKPMLLSKKVEQRLSSANSPSKQQAKPINPSLPIHSIWSHNPHKLSSDLFCRMQEGEIKKCNPNHQMKSLMGCVQL